MSPLNGAGNNQGCSGMLRDAQGCSDMFLIDRFETFWVNSSSYFIGMGCCRFYGCFGRLWEALGGFGRLWEALGCSEMLRKVPDRSI